MFPLATPVCICSIARPIASYKSPCFSFSSSKNRVLASSNAIKIFPRRLNEYKICSIYAVTSSNFFSSYMFRKIIKMTDGYRTVTIAIIANIYCHFTFSKTENRIIPRKIIKRYCSVFFSEKLYPHRFTSFFKFLGFIYFKKLWFFFLFLDFFTLYPLIFLPEMDL